MRRLLLLLVAITTAAAAAGCGLGSSGAGAPGAPEASELARESFRAAADAGSVRYGFTATLTAEGQAPMTFTVNGAAGKDAARADVSFSGDG